MKKDRLAASAAAVLSAAAVAGVTVCAAPRFTADDLRGLSSSILGESELSDGQDVNSDGRVDVYDMVEMRKTFGHSGEFAEQSIPASQQNVRYIGRNIFSDNTAWLVQSGSSVEFTITGRSAEITLCGDKNTSSNDNSRPRYAVLLDGEIIADKMLSGEMTIPLFKGDSSKTATVRVIHLSEANNGAVGVKNIKVDSDTAVPVAPTAEKKLKIEFIGDSITCAYGVEGKDQYENFKTSTENFMKSYAYITAELLNADHSAVAYSGHGIISGYSSNGDKETSMLVPELYGLVGKLDGYRVPWDFDSVKNDVIVVNLGTNDNSYTSKDEEARAPEFAEKYAEFLAEVHEKNPDAYIICTLGTMGCTELCPYIDQAVADFKAKTGYERIMAFRAETQDPSDGLGSDWHPSPVTQRNLACVLADKICQALGMESNQIGINVAADAEFSSEQSGSAMMSAYYSEWDGSYHITTVTGGEKPEDIQIFAGGIGLKQGGVYDLSFSLTTSDGAMIPFCIRDKSTGEVLFEDTFTGNGDKLRYEKELTCPKTCDAELVFSMGGTDSLRVSLYELKMVRNG